MELAKITEGYTGADIAALIREAGMAALRENISNPVIRWKHLEEALRKARPSVTRYMIEFYMRWLETARQLKAEEKKEVITPTITF